MAPVPAAPLFRFTQFELPWALGPPDGRYLVRDGAASEPTHVLVLATLGAPERRWLPSRKLRNAEPEPEPSPVATARATAVEVTAPFADRAQADAWLRRAGEADLAAGLAVLNRVLRAHRLAASDAHANAVAREQALVARV
ncbi:MAG: hypothetical protein JO240_18050, partial [Solirubrobacterales bacterium]|nr:hypothetical protein [Solirubrobacterales bacterium]